MANGLLEVILAPLQHLAYNILEPIPWVMGAILVLLAGYIVASILAWLVKKVLDKVQFERWVYDRAHLKKLFKGFKLNSSIAMVTKWLVFVQFFGPAADVVSLGRLASVLEALSLWIPNLIVALLIGFFGFIAADYVCDKIRHVKGRGHQFIADVTRVVILVFTAMVVLDQIGLQIDIAKNSFLIVLGGIALAFSLAVGLSVGLGMQKDAAKYVRDLKRKL